VLPVRLHDRCELGMFPAEVAEAVLIGRDRGVGKSPLDLLEAALDVGELVEHGDLAASLAAGPTADYGGFGPASRWLRRGSAWHHAAAMGNTRVRLASAALLISIVTVPFVRVAAALRPSVIGAGTWGAQALVAVGGPGVGRTVLLSVRIGACTRGPCQVSRAALVTPSCERTFFGHGGHTYIATGKGSDGRYYAIEIVDRGVPPAVPGSPIDLVGVAVTQLPPGPCAPPGASSVVQLGGFVVR